MRRTVQLYEHDRGFLIIPATQSPGYGVMTLFLKENKDGLKKSLPRY